MLPVSYCNTNIKALPSTSKTSSITAASKSLYDKKVKCSQIKEKSLNASKLSIDSDNSKLNYSKALALFETPTASFIQNSEKKQPEDALGPWKAPSNYSKIAYMKRMTSASSGCAVTHREKDTRRGKSCNSYQVAAQITKIGKTQSKGRKDVKIRKGNKNRSRQKKKNDNRQTYTSSSLNSNRGKIALKTKRSSVQKTGVNVTRSITNTECFDEEKKKIQSFLNTFFSSSVNTAKLTEVDKKKFTSSFIKTFADYEANIPKIPNNSEIKKLKALPPSIPKSCISNSGVILENMTNAKGNNENLEDQEKNTVDSNTYNFITKVSKQNAEKVKHQNKQISTSFYEAKDQVDNMINYTQLERIKQNFGMFIKSNSEKDNYQSDYNHERENLERQDRELHKFEESDNFISSIVRM